MRPSLSLSTIALLASFAYGFSSTTPQQQQALGFGSTFRPRPRVLVSHRSSSSIATTTKTMTTTKLEFSPVAIVPPGGGSSEDGTSMKSTAGPIDTGTKCPFTATAAVFGSFWGTFGVLYILGKAVKRVLPIALEPFQAGAVPLTQFQLAAYAITCLWFAYVEGYKGFQLKFSPLVVKRSFTLIPGKNGTKWWHYIFAPFYSMGLMHATRKRQIVSWSVSMGVAGIVAAVKKLPYPWRNIIDAGVVVGLSWGSLSILVYYVKAWVTGQPGSKDVDAALPDSVTGKKVE